MRQAESIMACWMVPNINTGQKPVNLMWIAFVINVKWDKFKGFQKDESISFIFKLIHFKLLAYKRMMIRCKTKAYVFIRQYESKKTVRFNHINWLYWKRKSANVLINGYYISTAELDKFWTVKLFCWLLRL